MRQSLRALSLACSIALVAGCGSSPPVLRGSIKVDPSANPDLRGRPSPIVLRVYELRALAAFNRADFFSLFEKEQEALGNDLVGREEYQLTPAENRPYQRQLQPDTKFLGVVAAFRDLEKARWRHAMPVPSKRRVTVTIGIQAQAVTLAVK
jgi:type VI secretion system protein VasD